MLKKYLIIVLLANIYFGYAQQGIYYQAKFLRDNYSVSPAGVKEISFKPNNLNDAIIKDLEFLFDVEATELPKVMNENPFFKADTITFNLGSSNASETALFTKLSGASIVNMDVTNLSKGLSQFLIKRAKEELTVAFFNRFKRFSDDNPEFKILFPVTDANLRNLLSYNYPQMLPALRNGFYEDLKGITYRLDNLLALPRYQTLLKDFPEIAASIRSIKIIHQLESGTINIADFIKTLANLPEFNANSNASDGFKNSGCGLKFISILSESLRKDKTDGNSLGNIWVGADDLKELVSDEVFFRIYMALIYQQVVKDKLKYYVNGNENLFENVLSKQADNLFLLQTKVSDIITLAGNIDNLVDDIRAKKQAKTITNDDYYNYINQSIGFLESAYEIVNIFYDLPTSGSFFGVIKKSNDIFKDSYTKQYTQLISDVVDLFSQVNNLVKTREEEGFQKAKKDLENSEIKDKNIEKIFKGPAWTGRFFGRTVFDKVDDEKLNETLINSSINEEEKALVTHYKFQKMFDFIEKVKPYALFMANMVEADTPDEVADALESAALPVGSSSIKKNTHFNIAVQAYLGAYLSDKDKDNSTFNSKFGVLAPIGIAITPGFLSWKRGGALTVFGTLLDVGAIVDYDLKRDTSATDGTTPTVKKDYKVKLGQIFSPGGYLVYGIGGNIPLSLGAGWQYGPGLSKIDDINGAEVINPAWRFSVFLAVDIPLFTLKNTIKQ